MSPHDDGPPRAQDTNDAPPAQATGRSWSAEIVAPLWSHGTGTYTFLGALWFLWRHRHYVSEPHAVWTVRRLLPGTSRIRTVIEHRGQLPERAS